MDHGESNDLTPDALDARLSAALQRQRSGSGRPTSDCPDEAQMATLLAREGEAAAAFLSHASSCDHCGPLVDAAMSAMPDRDDDHALLQNLASSTPEWRDRMASRLAAEARLELRKASPTRHRRWLWAGAGLAAAAALTIVAVRVVWPPASRPELAGLVAAVNVEPQRPVPGRLTGGFRYAAPPSLLRGPTGEASPRVRIAAAELEEAARAHDSAATQAAVGVGFLAVGDLDKAVDALETAVLEAPADARYQSDLSAAYLARATWADRADDWPKALAAAERAIKADGALVEAHFNRALALEGLHLLDEAIEAWTSYQGLEPDARWRDEAADHVRSLQQRLNAPKPQSNQDLRERIEDELLMRWGEAVLAGDAVAADRLLDEAAARATELANAGGDAMARDAVALIRKHRGDRAVSRTLANAHVLYGRARAAFEDNRIGDAADLMTQAAAEFGRRSSAYAWWGPVYRGMLSWVSGAPDGALRELAAVDAAAIPDGYRHFAGRYHWTRAVAVGMKGRFDGGRDALRAAVAAFEAAGETENLAATLAGLAEAEWLLGEQLATWRRAVAALRHLTSLGVTLRRNIVLIEGATFALNAGYPEAALHLLNSLVRSVEGHGTPTGKPDAYMRRARAHAALGHHDLAGNDLSRAEAYAGQVPDEALRSRYTAEVSLVRADIAGDDRAALDAANLAVDYFQRSGPQMKLSSLLLRRAQSFERLGQAADAERDYLAAVDAFERDHGALRTPLDRMQAFEQRRIAFRELVRFQSEHQGDMAAALRSAERGRGRGLVERLGGSASDSLAIDSLAGQLGPDVAIVFYVVLPARVCVWVITRAGSKTYTSSINEQELRADVRKLRRLIDDGATTSSLVRPSKRLFDGLVAPALALAPSQSVLVVVPDGPLSLVPFGSLPARDGRPLIATRAVAMAPSLAAFQASSARLKLSDVSDVLAIGDGHDVARSGLARLSRANDEAASVSRLYPKASLLTGEHATKRRLFESNHSVVHFAGHAVYDPEFPMLSRLYFAPDAVEGDNGTLLGDEIARHRFNRTQIVVLAACDTAAGRLIDGEGAISLARMFLEAGVPLAIANLWPVDEAAQPILLAFHQELNNGAHPVRALQSAQLAFLRDRGDDSPLRQWGGFVAIGGVPSAPFERRN